MSETISKSKQKRLDQRKARKMQRTKKAFNTFLAIMIPLAIVAVIVISVVIYQASILDYSRCLTQEGKIRGVTASDYVTVNYNDISLKRADLLPSEETVQSDISYLLSSHSYVSDDKSRSSVSGDMVSIYYKATLPDGTVYASADETTGAAKFTIGSAQATEDFDTALTGHCAGDKFTVDISYPADYSDSVAAGQTVKYEVEFLGIYTDPVFDDAFVASYYADEASSAEEFRQNIIDKYYEENLRSAVVSSLSVNSVVKSTPTKYEENMRKILMNQDQESMDYYNSMYMQYLGYNMYNNVYELYGFTSEAEYNASVAERAHENAVQAIEIQYIYENAGLSVTPEEIRNYYAEQGVDYEEAKNNFGEGYLAQAYIAEYVVKYLMEHVTIN